MKFIFTVWLKSNVGICFLLSAIEMYIGKKITKLCFVQIVSTRKWFKRVENCFFTVFKLYCLKSLNGKTMLCRLGLWLLFIANADQTWGLDWDVTLTEKSILSGPLNFGQNEDRFINVWSVQFLLRALFFSLHLWL